jgi:hypothetical protein
MLKQLRTILIVNAFFIIVFVGNNLTVWIDYNGGTSFSSSWNPLWEQITQLGTYRGFPTDTNLYSGPNFIFIIFFIAIAYNLYYINKLLKSKETKANPS